MTQAAGIKTRWTLRTLAAALLLALVPAAALGQDTSGKQDLLEAVEAARALTSLKADVELGGSGGFADWVPSGKGVIRLAKDTAVEPAAWHTRVDTTYMHKKGDAEKNLVVLSTPATLGWIDHEAKTVEQRSQQDRRSEFRSIPELFGLPELTSPEPYSRELREATSWASLPAEKVNGVDCEVVLVTFDLTKGEDARGGSMIRTQKAKWFFGKDDHLPRRVERLTDQAGLSFAIVQDVRNVEINPALTPADLAIQTPEGYALKALHTQGTGRQLVDGAKANTAESVDQEKAEAEKTARRIAEPDLPAHGFELVDADGNTVSLDSLQGSVAVLYFWGTWCVPCKEFSPLVSDLVSTFEGQPVRVFGLPVRERDEAAVRDAMKDYKHTLLLNPGGNPVGCDETARAYKVRRYPTVYVIGFESEILTVKWPETDVTPEATMAEVEKTIRDYLASRE